MAGQYVVITGASKGIGRATALYLAQRNFQVFAGVRNPKDGEALKQEAGSNLTALIIDVSKQETITEAATQVQKVVGSNGLFGLVNNAGIATAAPLEFLPLEELRQQLEVNVVGQLAVTQALLPLIRQAKGRIINITSIGGKIAGPMIGAYHASKFALEAMTDTLRLELKPWGIEVVAIEPGQIATPIWDTSIATSNRIMDSVGAKANEFYGARISKTQANAQAASKTGLPPEKVAEVIAESLTSPRPKTRYLIGRDAKIAGNIIARLPDRLRDRLMLAR